MHIIVQWMQFRDCNGKAGKKLFQEKYALMQWHTQAGNITTNIKVEVDFTLPTLSATNVVMCKCHMDDSAKGRYYMILGRDIFTELGLKIKFSEHVIEADDAHFKGSTNPWLIWVCIYSKIKIQGRLHLNNCLLMITSNMYMIKSM